MRKLFTLIGVAALALAALTATAQVVQYSGVFKEPVYSIVAADDTDVAMLVRYVGSTPDATDTVAVAAGGDITFQQNGAADTTLECPVSGALGGIIDVSDAACDTLGEVADIINASADWEAVILDGLRSDSSNDTIKTFAAADATGQNGLALNIDTDVAFLHSRAMVSGRTFKSFMPNNAVNGKVLDNPYLGSYTVLSYFSGKSTYGSGTSTIQVYAVKPRRGGETATLIWSSAGGATTALATLNGTNWPFGLIGLKDCKLIVRIANSAAAASVASNAYGATFMY